MEDNNKNAKYFLEEVESWRKFRDELNGDMSNKIVELITQKRQLLQNLTLLIATILGFSYFSESIKYYPYFVVGVVGFFLLIVLILLNQREVLDDDLNGMQKSLDKYNDIFDEKNNILNSYIIQRKFTDQDFQDYLFKLQTSEKIINLNKEVDNQVEERKTRFENMDYTAEIFLFIFILSAIFIFLSFLSDPVKYYYLVLIILAVLFVTFNNSSTLVLKKFSKIAHFLKKD